MKFQQETLKRRGRFGDLGNGEKKTLKRKKMRMLDGFSCPRMDLRRTPMGTTLDLYVT
jgi:hypothetical protein